MRRGPDVRRVDRAPGLTRLVNPLAAGAWNADAQEYQKATRGTRWFESSRSALTIKMLVEAENLGSSELEIGEITFPAGSVPRRGHNHTSIEIFYVLSGELEHVVNGESYLLTPGMVGIVRPGDEVIHRIPGNEPVRALVIWVPGGEAARIAPGFDQRPGGSGSGGR